MSGDGHAAEAALSQAWERLLGRKVPQTAAAGRRRQRFAVSFSSSSEGWIEGQQATSWGTALASRTRLPACVFVGLTDEHGGSPHGPGVMLNEDGILLEGTWEQGALIGEGSARRWDEAGMPLWHYVGTWAQGMFAKGTVTYLPEGDSYEGEFFANVHMRVRCISRRRRLPPDARGVGAAAAWARQVHRCSRPRRLRRVVGARLAR